MAEPTACSTSCPILYVYFWRWALWRAFEPSLGLAVIVLIHPLLAGNESLSHMVNHLKAPDTFVWPLNFPTGDIRPPRARDARIGTDFDPDPGGGEDAPLPDAPPALRLAA
ncbi:hypothetical protein ACGFMO_25900 [Streptomyces niveus]|uniref:hypothetical protein n=1 Tax=Streptomyces niveus TaxID=193462 RepID=UPI0037107C12